jgi:pantoate--beta-alanine ligase
MAEDFDLRLTVQECQTLREDDGLAFSSRNARLSQSARQEALVLHRSLTAAAAAFTAGERDPRHLEAIMRACFEDSAAQFAYADVIDDRSFESATSAAAVPWRAVVAARLEGVHLLDNLPLGTS